MNLFAETISYRNDYTMFQCSHSSITDRWLKAAILLQNEMNIQGQRLAGRTLHVQQLLINLLIDFSAKSSHI